MNVLGIETSCDETAAAVVRDGRQVLSSVVFSQVALHAPYGGVVPEIASRNHAEYLPRVLEQSLTEAGLTWDRLDAVAVTYGPGLATSLLVGLAAAKALALRLKIPLIGINHLEAHIYSVFLSPAAPALADACPCVALVVSGGHTCLVRVEAPGQYRLLGWTVDDAAGEAFDKGAKLLGLGYPGGPAIDRVSRGIDPGTVRFPRGLVIRPAANGRLRSDLCFSFSGLKTALLYYLKNHPCAPGTAESARVTAAYQEAIVDTLATRMRAALDQEQVRQIAAAGGVALNSRLRERLAAVADAAGVSLLLPLPQYCGDNAAMVAGLAGVGQGVTGAAAWALDALPNPWPPVGH